jgi:hypothetical protein
MIAYGIGGLVVVPTPAGRTSKIIFFSDQGKALQRIHAVALLAFALHLCSGVGHGKPRLGGKRGSVALFFLLIESQGP